MAQGSIHGRLVWQELTSEDPASAVIFYSKLVGWHAHPNASHPAYTEFGIGGSHYAGMTPLTADARAAGVRSHWLPYIGASDVDSTVATAQQLGATVVHAAQDLEHVGRFATLKDPQGAQFAVFKPSGSGGGAAATSGKPAVGSFAWLELATSDYEAASAFYGKLFGWQVMSRMDMGPAGTYLIFGADGVQLGGMYKMHAERTSEGYWLPYAEVSNADAAASVATAAGGRIVVGPMDVPGGRMVQVLDPSGAMFAVHSAVAAAAPKPAAPKPAAPKLVSAAPPANKPATPPPAAAAAPKPAAPPVVKPAAAPAAAPAAKPAAAKKPAPKKAVAKKPAAKKPAASKKAAGKKAAAKKKGVSKKSSAKSAKKSAKKASRKSAKKAARKSGAGKKKPAKRGGKARRKK